LSSILVYKSYKHYKLFVSDKYIIKQEGAWDIDTIIIEPHKIQTIATHQYFWQKKTNIGSVTISTAGGNVHFSTANFSEIKQWVNYWLYQVESTNKSWI
jgi:putative membrane protein